MNKRNQLIATLLSASLVMTPAMYTKAEEMADVPQDNADTSQELLLEKNETQERTPTSNKETDEANKEELIPEQKEEPNGTMAEETQAPSSNDDTNEEEPAKEPVNEEQDQAGKEPAKEPAKEPEKEAVDGAAAQNEAKPELTDEVAKEKMPEVQVLDVLTSESENENQVRVQLKLAGTEYDQIVIGKKEAPIDRTSIVKGVSKESGCMTFEFELEKSQTENPIYFVPGIEKDGTWNQENDYFFDVAFAEEAVGRSARMMSLFSVASLANATEVAEERYVVAEVATSSKMFKVTDCILTKKDGQMTARITLSGTGYDMLYMGTKEEAEAASSADYISSVDGNNQIYEIPVAALDQPIAVATHGSKWYDRTITFSSDQFKKTTVEDGEYTEGTVTSDSAMFKVVRSVITTTNGKMTAVITLSKDGYDKLFMGTDAEAAAADASEYIPFVKDEEGKYTFTVPVEALDQPIPVAAYSVKNKKWYPRMLTFASEGLKKTEAETPNPGTPGTENPGSGTSGTGTNVGAQKPADTKPEEESAHVTDTKKSTGKVDNSTKVKDGVYTPDKFSWSGGTGKVSISCSKVTVTNGQAFATITFSSSNYGYVKANGNTYYAAGGGGGSTFTIPVELNKNNTIVGMTTAMGTPHEIAYQIFVYLNAAAEANLNEGSTEKLDDKAPTIQGLEYEKEVMVEHSELFKIYQYDQGITLLEVDMVNGTAREEKEAAETFAFDGYGMNPQEEEQAKLYENNVVKYLIVPEDVEVAAGLEKEMIIVKKPLESLYTDEAEMVGILADKGQMDLIKTVGFETCEEKDLQAKIDASEIPVIGKGEDISYKDLVKTNCDFAVVSSDVLPAKEERESEKQYELYMDQAVNFTMLSIPMFVDRSQDEREDAAKQEWDKVYEILFGDQK